MYKVVRYYFDNFFNIDLTYTYYLVNMHLFMLHPYKLAYYLNIDCNENNKNHVLNIATL